MKRRSTLLLGLILIVTMGLIVFGLASDTIQKKTTRITHLPDRISTLGYFDFTKQLSLSVQYAFWPAIAVNSNGTLMVCYAGDDQDIFYTMSFDGGASWTAPVRSFSINEEPKSIDLDADAAGNFHMCYSDGGSSYTREIYHREFKNNEWQPRTQISQSFDNANWCRIATDGNRVHIVWYQELGWPTKPTIFLKTREEGGAWPASPEDVTQDPGNGGISPCVTAGNGNVYVAWQRQLYSGETLTGKEVVFREKRGASWRPTVALGVHTWPGIQADTIGNVHVVYADSSKAKYRMRLGDTWQNEMQIDTTSAVAGFFDLAFRNNTLIAVLMQNASRNPAHYSIYYRTRDAAQGWGPWDTAVEVDPGGYADLPKVVMDNEGYAHILWADWHTQEIREPDTIWYNKFLVGGPDVPFLLLDKYTISYSITQGEAAPDQIFKVKNSGPGTINFQVTAVDDFITVSPGNGTSEGDWVEFTVNIDTNIPVGVNNGTIQITSDEADNSPAELTVSANIIPPPIFPPLNFTGVQSSNNTVFYREYVNHLTWEANPLNDDILHYRITIEYELNGIETTQVLEIESTNFEYTHHNVNPDTEYTYTLQAVNDNGTAGQSDTVVIGD